MLAVTLCRNCGRTIKSRAGRGLCRQCWDDPEIREGFAPLSDFGGDTRGATRAAWAPIGLAILPAAQGYGVYASSFDATDVRHDRLLAAYRDERDAEGLVAALRFHEVSCNGVSCNGVSFTDGLVKEKAHGMVGAGSQKRRKDPHRLA